MGLGVSSKGVEDRDENGTAIDDAVEAGVELGDAFEVEEHGLGYSLGADAGVASDKRQHGRGMNLNESGVGTIVGDSRSCQPRLGARRGDGASGEFILDGC